MAREHEFQDLLRRAAPFALWALNERIQWVDVMGRVMSAFGESEHVDRTREDRDRLIRLRDEIKAAVRGGDDG